MEDEAPEYGRVVKRQRLENAGVKEVRHPGASRVFAPYRTVGLVSPTAVPFTSVPLGKTTFQITTSTGRSLQTYDLRRGLNLVFVTRPHTPEIITASAAWKDKLVAAWAGDDADSRRGIWVFKRGQKETELEVPRGWSESVKNFCIFGSWLVAVCDTQLLVWKEATWELYTTLRGISPIPFTPCLSNLPTFLNKIIAGREDGSAEIWNISSGKLVYTILPPSTTSGAVTAIEPTPALSLVAIAFESGPVLIHDVRADQTVLHLSSPAGLPVTSISFRTDGLGAGEDGRTAGVMATSSSKSGDITLWDLNNGGRKAGVLQAAHMHPTVSSPGGVGKVEFLSGQAVLVSSGLDNSLKTWIFDETTFSPVPRILHSRSGHGAPVTRLEFLPSAADGADDTGKWLMSASKDRSLWGWSLRRDGQSTELSQGAIQKSAKKQGLLSEGGRDKFDDLKCPPIIDLACSLNRDGGIGAVPGKHPIWKGIQGKNVSAEISSTTGWESVVTVHENDKKARTWFWGRKRAGRWAFETGDRANATSVAMSPCGTFALVGSEKGGIDMFNMQSGIHRQRFPARLTPMQAKQLRLDAVKHGLIEEDEGKKKFYRGQGKHAHAVVGIAVDSLNRTVVSAGGDGRVKFWDFASGLLRDEIDWTASARITGMRFHRGSDLAAFACAEGCIRIVDISTCRLIRELWPSRPMISQLQGLHVRDFAFSTDARWLAACMGQVVLLWDLPTGHLIDAFRLKASCTSIGFSPTGEFLATACEGSVGVDIWSNRSLFTHIPTRRLAAEELAEIVKGAAQLPTVSGGEVQNQITVEDEEEDLTNVDLVDGMIEPDVDQISAGLLSLSLVPASRWQNLLHLDSIRQRNKPIEPARKPEKAPFFLPSLQDKAANTSTTNANPQDPANLEQERSRVLKLTQTGSRSTFTTLLYAARDRQDYTPFLSHLQTLSPAAADIEIRSLSAERGEMAAFVHALLALMRERRDFELGQTWMAVFLRIHGDVVAREEGLRGAVGAWREALEGEKVRVSRLAEYCGGLLGYLRAARV